MHLYSTIAISKFFNNSPTKFHSNSPSSSWFLVTSLEMQSDIDQSLFHVLFAKHESALQGWHLGKSILIVNMASIIFTQDSNGCLYTLFATVCDSPL